MVYNYKRYQLPKKPRLNVVILQKYIRCSLNLHWLGYIASERENCANECELQICSDIIYRVNNLYVCIKNISSFASMLRITITI